MADTVEQIMASDGWDQFDVDTADKEDLAAAAKELEFAGLVRQTYSTDAGKVVLRRMIEAYLTCPVVEEHDTQFAAGIREGQARIVREILGQIEFSERGIPQED